jgi:hypothetical protein
MEHLVVHHKLVTLCFVVLQIESFKNSKLGSRIRFHFRRNPYFQNNVIMKEVHLGMGGEHYSREGELATLF